MLKQLFSQIHKNYFKRLFYFFYRKAYVTSEIAEDLVSETFFRAYKYCQEHKISSEIEIIKLIYGIAKNVYKEWVSKNINLSEVEFCEEICEIQDDFENIQLNLDSENENDDISEFELKQNELISKCLNIIETFSDNLRLVMKYIFVEGLSRAETAKLLNISEDAVHTYQKRGVSYIKERLKIKNAK